MTATGHLCGCGCGCGWSRYRPKPVRTKYRYHCRVRKAEVTSPAANTLARQGLIICFVLPRLWQSNRKLPVLGWRASGHDSWPPALALVTGRPFSRDLNKISRQNLVQRIGSRANVVSERTRRWVGRHSVWTPTEASNSSLSKTPRPAVGLIEPPVSKMGTGVLPQV